MKTLWIVSIVVLLGGCSEQSTRQSLTFHENAAGGTYNTYWTSFKKVASFAQQNCVQYGKNAVLTVQNEYQATFQCR